MKPLQHVTLSSKCYIVACLVCHRVFDTSRTGALTCGVRCRVWLHRHPEELESLRAQIDRANSKTRWRPFAVAEWQLTSVFQILELEAANKFRPDLVENFLTGKSNIAEVRDAVCREFTKRLIGEIEESRSRRES
jgi:hypothetical protein